MKAHTLELGSPTAGITEAPAGLQALGPPVPATPSLRLCLLLSALLPASSAPCSVFILGSQLQHVGETGPVTAVSSVLLLVLRYKSRFHAGVPRGS